MGVAIQFKKVRFQNLFSYGNNVSEVDLSIPQLHLIVGHSGAGKSTILDAILFGMFGKPYKKVNKSSIINSVNDKGTLVEIEFSVGKKEFLVRRGLKPTVFEIFQDGEMIDKDGKSTDLQKKLENNILGGINSNTFMQTAIIGSANFIPFMQLSSAQRREVVESILSLQIFSYASDITKRKIKEETEERNKSFQNHRLQDSKMQEKSRNLSILLSKKEQDTGIQEEQLRELDEQISDTNARITQKKELATSIKEELQSIDQSSIEKIDSMKQEGVEKNSERKKLKEMLDLWDKGKCPTCHQTLDKNDNTVFDYDASLNEIEEIEVRLSKLRTQLEEATSLKKTLETKKKEGQDIVNQMKTLKVSLDHLEKNKIDLQKKPKEDISDKHIKEYQKEILKLENEIEELSSLIKNIDGNLSSLKECQTLFKDNGIKGEIIKVFVPLINQKLNEYLQLFEMDIEFNFDHNFDETIKGRGRDDYVYNNLSEGEKRRVDLAILFMWLYIAETKNSANMNLLCCDELLDSSLDYDSVQNLVKILERLIHESGKSIFIISHRSELKDAFFDKVYNVRKEGQFSQIEEI